MELVLSDVVPDAAKIISIWNISTSKRYVENLIWQIKSLGRLYAIEDIIDPILEDIILECFGLEALHKTSRPISTMTELFEMMMTSAKFESLMEAYQSAYSMINNKEALDPDNMLVSRLANVILRDKLRSGNPIWTNKLDALYVYLNLPDCNLLDIVSSIND
jgi:hypothetical protein